MSLQKKYCAKHGTEMVLHAQGKGKPKKPRCRECNAEAHARCYAKDSRGTMITHARQRAKRFDVPFYLTKEDIVIPTHCPVLGVELKQAVGSCWHSRRHNDSPSLDRIRPEFGYVPGNIAIISWRANHLKHNGTLDEMQKVVAWMQRVIVRNPKAPSA